MQETVSCVALEDIADEEGSIAAEGVIVDDVVSETLAVLIPAGLSLGALRRTYPRILIQLSKHGVTHLNVKGFESLKPQPQSSLDLPPSA